ncbi:MAG: hypothetical protein ACI8PZ_005033 [Myxococcota bacterium]|jgi:hypothetical protein
MDLMKIVLLVGACGLAACSGSNGYDEAASESDWQANGGENFVSNGEPTCVVDVCAVLDMYADCVASNPVQAIDAAQAAYVERQCEQDEGECCDQGYYISPEAASCITGNPGFTSLKYHLGHQAPIWEISDALISEVHAANGSILSEREQPPAS